MSVLFCVDLFLGVCESCTSINWSPNILLIGLRRVNSTNSTDYSKTVPRPFPSYLLFILLLYLLFMSYFPRCTLPDLASASSLASLPFLFCYDRTTTIPENGTGGLHVLCASINWFQNIFLSNIAVILANIFLFAILTLLNCLYSKDFVSF